MRNKEWWPWMGRVITGIFSVMLTVSLYFALTSENLLLQAESTTWLTLVGLAVLACLGAMLLTDNTVRRQLIWLIKSSGWWGIGVSAAIVILVQVSLVLATHPAIGFDAGMVHRALIHPTDVDVRGYFSQNYNNIPLVLLQHMLGQWLHSNSWLTMDWLTLIAVDSAALINLLTARLLGKQYVRTLWFIQALGLLIFPMIIVPYTDTWVLPAVASGLLGTAMLLSKNRPWWLRILGAVVTGVATVAAGILKPSAIIPMVAIVALAAASGLRYFKWRKLMIGAGLALILATSSSLTYVGLQGAVKRQHFLAVNPALKIPAIHFINMGMSGRDGSYNPDDALKMAELPAKKDKIAYSQKMIKKRLKERGIGGYATFLARKQGYNMEAGSFGWLGEGTFMHVGQPDRGWRWIYQTLLYPTGANTKLFFFVSQLVWIGMLSVTLCGWQRRDFWANALRLALIGAWLFLLIFEGGRSRYMIQFLPAMLLLTTITWEQAVQVITRALINIGFKQEKGAVIQQ